MTVTAADVDAAVARLKREAESRGYRLNPDAEALRSLAEGLLVNSERYGYPSCPCRLSFGEKDQDRDIICPCDYRDPDLDEFGACYCGLYVSEKVFRGEEELRPVPERRGADGGASAAPGDVRATFPYPVHRCRVCGYLCAREAPPEKCPICLVGRERFERFA